MRSKQGPREHLAIGLTGFSSCSGLCTISHSKTFSGCLTLDCPNFGCSDLSYMYKLRVKWTLQIRQQEVNNNNMTQTTVTM